MNYIMKWKKKEEKDQSKEYTNKIQRLNNLLEVEKIKQKMQKIKA